MKTSKKWWSEGLRFECQGSGNCCVSHGEYGFVYVTQEDRQNMAKALQIPTAQFTRKYCQKTDGFFHLKDNGQDCLFLKEKRCTVYKARPTQCRTWPFWPETLSAKAWKKDVVGFCPGVGKGRLWTAKEIEAQVQSQKDWEETIAQQASKE